MGLFKALVSTVINVATLPIDVVKDVATLGGTLTERRESYTAEKIQKIKDEADENE